MSTARAFILNNTILNYDSGINFMRHQVIPLSKLAAMKISLIPKVPHLDWGRRSYVAAAVAGAAVGAAAATLAGAGAVCPISAGLMVTDLVALCVLYMPTSRSASSNI